MKTNQPSKSNSLPWLPALAVNFCAAEWREIEALSMKHYGIERIAIRELETEAQSLAWRCAVAMCALERRKAECRRLLRGAKKEQP